MKILRIFFSIVATLTQVATVQASNNHQHDPQSTFQMIHDKAPKLDQKVLKLALNAYDHAQKRGLVKNHVLTVVDMELASSQKRMWVINLDSQAVPFYTYVAHGKASGAGSYANKFSNAPGSRETSLGTYVTANTYQGGKGYSLRLQGLEKGFNDKAMSRAIVMHGAWYADENFARTSHTLGHSWGCPAVDRRLAKPIIDTIKNGSVIFMYYPDRNYLTHSAYV